MQMARTGRINRAWSCEEAVLASLTWICDAEQLFTDAALVLDASTRVAAVARSGQIDLHLHCVVDHADEKGWVAGCINHALDLVCIMSICHTEQLYTDAALVLDASTRVVASAGKWPDRSALALRSRPCKREGLQVASTVLMLVCA